MSISLLVIMSLFTELVTTSSSIKAQTYILTMLDILLYGTLLLFFSHPIFFHLLAPSHTKVAGTHFGYYELKVLPTSCRYTLSRRTNRLKNSFVPERYWLLPTCVILVCFFLGGLSFALDNYTVRSRSPLHATI